MLDGGTYVLEDLDTTELAGTYAGNRLKKYWSRQATKANRNDVVDEHDSVDEHDIDVEISSNSDISDSAANDGDFDGISNNDAEDADVGESDIDDDVSLVFSDNDLDLHSDRQGNNGLADKDNNTPHRCPTHESLKWPLPGCGFYVRLQ